MKIYSRKGFSFLEIMVGVVILLISTTGLLMGILYCVMLNESSHNLVSAVNDAQFVLEQMKALSYDSISAYTAPALNNLPNETITLNRTVGANLASITVNVNWQERERGQTYSLTTCMAR